MVRIESNEGLTQVRIEGHGLKIMAESLTAVSALWKSLDEEGVGNIFRVMLTKEVITGELFEEPDRKENLTGLSHEEMLDVWRDMEKDKEAIWENILKKGMVDK